MFESAYVQQGTNAWTMTGSLALQILLLSAALLGSLFYPIALPAVPDVIYRPSAPRLPPHVRLIATPRPTATARHSQILNSGQLNSGQSPIYWGAPAQQAPSADFSGLPELEDGAAFAGIGEQGGPAASSLRQLPPPLLPAVIGAPAKTEEAAPAVSRITIGGNVLAAQIIHRPAPVYPPIARQMRVEGVVQLRGVISREGRIIDLRVVSGHPLLAAAALAAVREWRYQPTFLNGQPVEVEAPIEVRFVLGR
jgi:protein TonB